MRVVKEEMEQSFDPGIFVALRRDFFFPPAYVKTAEGIESEGIVWVLLF